MVDSLTQLFPFRLKTLGPRTGSVAGALRAARRYATGGRKEARLARNFERKGGGSQRTQARSRQQRLCGGVRRNIVVLEAALEGDVASEQLR